MIFGIDVRQRVCKKYCEWMELVNLQTELRLLDEKEESKEIKKILTKIDKLLDQVVDIRKEEMRKETDTFEVDFINDIMNNKEFYEFKVKEA